MGWAAPSLGTVFSEGYSPAKLLAVQALSRSTCCQVSHCLVPSVPITDTFLLSVTSSSEHRRGRLLGRQRPWPYWVVPG